VTSKRPYPDDYPSGQERQGKAEGEYFPSQIKKLPHLAGRISGSHHPFASIWMHPSDGYPDPLPTWHLAGRGCTPSPTRRNNSLPPCTDAIDDALMIDSGTQHDSVGNTASIPHARGKFSRKRSEKEKTP